ncbi:hypothetical protein thalar_02654 [Litoreibacter arenae DSM 19593]|uniref:Uncharacterized protein n=1 Tax=Litoreibacter arenae DSM 19593 TaxID=1123360 RepID=S9RFQ8_9RHOB|nr:hypothetical protein thalar_02654 [Litoreibacter arenae DSM 19593]
MFVQRFRWIDASFNHELAPVAGGMSRWSWCRSGPVSAGAAPAERLAFVYHVGFWRKPVGRGLVALSCV